MKTMHSDPIEEYVDVGDATFWTCRQGTGPPMVLLHGGPGLWDYLGPMASMFDDLVTVYRFDQRACGRSSGGPPFTLDGAIEDIEALRRHWGHERWIVVGHSWGADLALWYALAKPNRTAALLLISGTGVDSRGDARCPGAGNARRIGPETSVGIG